MQNFDQVKKQLRPGDRKVVAEMLGVSRYLVSAVTQGTRKDHHKIKEALKELVESRKQLAKKIKKEHA